MVLDFTPLVNLIVGIFGGNLLELGVWIFGLALVWRVFDVGLEYLKSRAK
jgi:hypothetical protein